MTRSWTTQIVVAATVVAALAFATTALADIAGPSSSSGGTAPDWMITFGTASWSGTLTGLYPGAPDDTERLPFTLTNHGRQSQRLSSITALILTAPDGDAETAAGADIPGCRAGWFTVAIDPHDAAVPATVAPAGSYAGQVDLTMRDSGTDQDACRIASPGVTVRAS